MNFVLPVSVWCVLAALNVASPARAQAHPPGSAHPPAGHWSYGERGGPAEWGGLDEAFASCEHGKLQSPIDIRESRTADLPPIKFHYQPARLKVVDSGHTIQVNYPKGSSIQVGTRAYDLVQFHFHRPSEETIGGKSHAMVAHLVHKAADGKLAVVAVLLDAGQSNATFHAVMSHLPRQKGKEVAVAATIDAAALLPAEKGYYSYRGSLTTPPCSEDVQWFVLKMPTPVAARDMTAFARIYPMNARPTQPLNGRTVEVTP